MTFRQLQLRWQSDHPDVGAATAARPTGADELMAIFEPEGCKRCVIGTEVGSQQWKLVQRAQRFG